MILDFIVVGLVALSFFISARKGLVKSIWRLAALIITITLVMAFKTPAVEYLKQTELCNTVYNAVHEKLSLNDYLTITEEPSENNDKFYVPQFIVDAMIKSGEIQEGTMADHVSESLSKTLTYWAIEIIASVGLFILIRLLLMAAFTIINAVVKLPLINQANALLGGLLGAVNMLAAVYIACALLSLFAEGEIVGLIQQSYIVKYFYNYNILLQLIMKI